MVLSWGSGRPDDWLGFPVPLPAQCGASAARLLSLFTQSWQAQACGSKQHLPRCLPPWTTGPVPCPQSSYMPSLQSCLGLCFSEIPHRFAQFPLLGRYTSISLHRAIQLPVGTPEPSSCHLASWGCALWTRHQACSGLHMQLLISSSRQPYTNTHTPWLCTQHSSTHTHAPSSLEVLVQL